MDSFLALEYNSFLLLLESFGKSIVCGSEDLDRAITRWASHKKETRVPHVGELARLAGGARKHSSETLTSSCPLDKEVQGENHSSFTCGDLVARFDELSLDVVDFVVPRDGFYYILGAGGKAEDPLNTVGGRGAVIGGLLWLFGGEVIQGSVGHKSRENHWGGSAGGNATYVSDRDGNPLIVAGGGGAQGGDNMYSVDGTDAELYSYGSRGVGSVRAQAGAFGMKGKGGEDCSDGGDGFVEAVHGDNEICVEHPTCTFRALRGRKPHKRGFGRGGAGYSGGGGNAGGGGGSFICDTAKEELRLIDKSGHGWIEIYYGWLPNAVRERLNRESQDPSRGYDGLQPEWRSILPGF